MSSIVPLLKRTALQQAKTNGLSTWQFSDRGWSKVSRYSPTYNGHTVRLNGFLDNYCIHLNLPVRFHHSIQEGR